jgi:hypothetical protein
MMNYFYVDVSGYEKPVGYPKPAWVWVWAKFYTRHGYGFFSGRIFSSRVWVWASITQRVFTHCHLYLRVELNRRRAGEDARVSLESVRER